MTTNCPIALGIGVYYKSSQGNTTMQLTSKDANMVVDFYPVKYSDGDISTRYILKTVTFMGQSQSKRYILKSDFDREVDSRVEGYGYEVTEMHTEPQLFNSAMCLAC
ncbi:hypothetical protein CYXG_00033 [Synechococcus phage S-SSM4]|uniref:Uncharacterized protein n=1 Tax=Synechococcus phage S-SSM4 TaxID=536466 RepID=M1UFW2_9CAUD|nr:hypothetical protein CYXG_00033 [Synechococcus phage S-SSM4]AGG54097.1 hypothetical protein CYXG_00033 [Synechococcus phage S-SSM4]AGG54326.1 hypothetical protein CYWG_00042 [Cyanophage S-SSM6b]